MRSTGKYIALAMALTPLMLTACGEGYEMRPYHGVPYTDERTAGSGVEYVRASLMPKRELNTTKVMEAPIVSTVTETKTEEVVVPAAVPNQGDKLFHQDMGK